MKKIALHWQVIIALVLGLIYAALAVNFGWANFTKNWIEPFGDIFINVLKLIAVPLVLFSIIVGMASLKDVRKLGKLGGKTLGMYLATTIFAVTLGLVVVNLWQPGARVSDDLRSKFRIEYELWAEKEGVEKLDDIDMLNDPAMAELVAKVRDEAGKKELNPDVQKKIKAYKDAKKAGETQSVLQPLVDVFPKNLFEALTKSEMLQIIFFALFFGVALISIKPEKAAPIVRALDTINDIFVEMIMIAMRFMPFFVFALMAGKVVGAAGSDIDLFKELIVFMLHYSGAVILGLALMIFVVYPNLVSAFVKKMSYSRFLSGIRKAQITAFSTSSSVATLPVTMECVNENLGVSERTTSFVLPIGATVNMDGTSLYQAIAVVGLAQLHMVDLSFGQQATIVITATLASIGAAAVPSAGLVLMILVLESVGLNGAWIALVFPVDRILDMCRTVVNVTGDASVSTIIANSEGELDIPAENKIL